MKRLKTSKVFHFTEADTKHMLECYRLLFFHFSFFHFPKTKYFQQVKHFQQVKQYFFHFVDSYPIISITLQSNWYVNVYLN